MDWFLYDNGLRHERVKIDPFKLAETTSLQVCLIHSIALFQLHLLCSVIILNKN